MRLFNTVGPVDSGLHDCVLPLERLEADELPPLIRRRKYFVPHAPRQWVRVDAR